MSGGSLNYAYIKFEEVAEEMDDREVRDLIQDLADLIHDFEWYLSDDYSKASYEESLKDFKDKWFGKDRNMRLKEYINEALDNMKQEIDTLI